MRISLNIPSVIESNILTFSDLMITNIKNLQVPISVKLHIILPHKHPLYNVSCSIIPAYFSKPYQCCPITKIFSRSRVTFHVNVYISSNISVVLKAYKGGIISVFRWLVTPCKWPRGHKLYRRDCPYMDGPSAITYQCITQGQLFILHCVFYWCQGPRIHICFKGIG